MRKLRGVFLRLTGLFNRRCRALEFDAELESNLQMHIEDNLRSGMSPEEARYAALRKFGNVTRVREDAWELWSFVWLEHLWQDGRFALRTLRKNPGFTVLAVLTLSLGIGANTAIFSVVHAVLLRPLAYPHPDRIVRLATSWPKYNLYGPVSAPDCRDWHDQSTTYDAMAYYDSAEMAVRVGSIAEYGRMATVTPEFFRVFEVEPERGRLFTADEEKRGRSSGVVVISHSYSESHFGATAGALGRTIRLQDISMEIVGVLPPGFHFPDKTDIWFPEEPTDPGRFAHNYMAVGRLKAGVSLEAARTEIAGIAARLARQYPESNEGKTVTVTRMRDEMVKDVRLMLYLMLAAVGAVLLIACANVANLLLAKANARSREITIRGALGASRSRVVRQLITESLMLALTGGVSGTVLAFWAVPVLIGMAPGDTPRLAEAGINGWVLAFSFGVSMLAGLLFGLAPAVHASRINLSETLKQGGTGAGLGSGLGRVRSAFVIAELALSVMLLAGAALLVRSFVALHNVVLGFRPEHVLVMHTNVPASGPEGARRAMRYYRDLLAEVSTLPGVRSVGATMALPGHVQSMGPYWINHPPDTFGKDSTSVIFSVVAPGTFAALGMPLKGGRDFDNSDTYDAPATAIINESLARKAFPGQNPIGRMIGSGLEDWTRAMKIVGVVGDIRQFGPAQPPSPEIYMPYEQHPHWATYLRVLVRTTAEPGTLVESVRRKSNELSSDVPVTFTTLENSLAEDAAAPRFRTLLLSIFAALAVALAMAGVYGVMTYVVGQRTNEVGLRMALGASRGSVLRLMLGEASFLVGVGTLLGVAGAMAASRLLASMLFQVKPTDPVVHLGVGGLLSLVAILACYLPARRATKVDPMVALRYE
jgi:putative ABC transport system permease protein